MNLVRCILFISFFACVALASVFKGGSDNSHLAQFSEQNFKAIQKVRAGDKNTAILPENYAPPLEFRDHFVRWLVKVIRDIVPRREIPN